MKAAAALILHVLSVHYLFVLFLVGVPVLVIGLLLRNKPVARRYGLSYICYALFVVFLAGAKVFPVLNELYLNRYGVQGEAVIVSANQEPAWFRRTPEVRLVLNIVPDAGPSFIEAVNAAPSLEVLDNVQVGQRVRVKYAPQYTHNVMVSSWQ